MLRRGIAVEPSRTTSFSAMALAISSGILGVLAGFGTRSGWWDFRVGFQILTWAAFAAAAAACLALVAVTIALVMGRVRALVPALVGLVVGLVVAGVPWQLKQMARQVPPIHDITTDTEDPPKFVAILPARKYAPNPPTYGGPDIAAQQRTGYPDIRPLSVQIVPEEAFRIAVATAREMGWELVAVDAGTGRIEATDTTFWFGFKDDVIVRVKGAPDGTRIDVRSVSRVGKSDVGTNAKRIRKYLERIAKGETRTGTLLPR